MILEYITVDKNYHHLSKIKYLFDHAFPIEERPPFSRLLEMKKNTLFGVEQSGELVGLLSIVARDDLLYIFFLAVKEKLRGKGYGSKILQDVLKEHPNKRVFLMAEDPSIPSSNQEERDSRIRFYNHNGFRVTDTKITEYGVEYVVLSNSGDVSKNEFLNLMEYLLDDYYSIYKNYVE